MMILMREDWNLRHWHDWLVEEMHLHIGRDWQWAWHNDRWGIEFFDPRNETAVRLKANVQ